jgi:membrane associated rhomboid family serine protease
MDNLNDVIQEDVAHAPVVLPLNIRINNYCEKLMCSFILWLTTLGYLIYLIQVVVNLLTTTQSGISYEFPDEVHEWNWICSLYKLGAKYTPSITLNYHLHRLVTPIFLHNSLLHLILNSLSLIIINAFSIEKEVGHFRFLFLYFMGGICSNLISALFSKYNLIIGTSGIILSLVGNQLVMYFVNSKKINLAYLTIICLFQTILHLTSKSAVGYNIDIYSLIGGVFAGVIISFIIYKPQGESKYSCFFSYHDIILVLFIGVLILLTLLIFDLPNTLNIVEAKCRRMFYD